MMTTSLYDMTLYHRCIIVVSVCLSACYLLSDDADAKLTPVKPPVGFRKVVRVKIGEDMID